MTDYSFNSVLYVDGEATSSAFPVTTSFTATAGEFKDDIRGKMIIAFSEIDTHQRTLCVFVAITSDDGKLHVSRQPE